ncbi:Serine/threonine-protein kinase PknB [Rubripirellula lacrimiformis]|uniref:Serine/threonine-protein kinase PknB n=1 Tax=Rubripirellula lacrimiformis TaxID=1930273 RepID=A0A517NEB5_9BACT|nr:serine/threonine-protein kinase [Rubripirellula lacrimiformis]QDT05460.1 Serine/threonine-protein kinase PknB [Rubripirellula lacrimiformis]
MSKSLNRLVELLIKSGTVSEGQIEGIRAELAAMGDREDSHTKDRDQVLAKQLTDSGVLTDFQACSVRDGKSDELVLDDYLILDEIGSGGMGSVYRARHTVMGREVAVKFAKNDDPDASDDERFRREVEALSRLVHPNIVSALDAGYRGANCYLVMEYVEGMDLSTHVKKNGTMSFPDALNVLVQAAEGLKFVHKNNIIHRDIKPGNILICGDRQVKLLDVGLARFGDGATVSEDDVDTKDLADQAPVTVDATTDANLTQRGQIVGTIDYMAPEQAVDSRKVSPSVDIYGLGCTFHFLVTGNPPYRERGKSTLERVIAHREKAVPLLSQRCRDVPTEFDPIFTKMLAKSPSKRYRDASELLGDLRRIQRDFSSVLSDQSPRLQSMIEARSRRRRLIQWSLVGGAAMLTIAILAGLTVHTIRRQAANLALVMETIADDLPGDVDADNPSEGKQAVVSPPKIQTVSPPLDLFGYLDTDRSIQTGTGWELTDTELLIPNSTPSLLSVPIRVLEEYRLIVTVRRVEGTGPLVMFLPVHGQSQCFILIDSQRSSESIAGIGFTSDGRLISVQRRCPPLGDQPQRISMDVRDDGIQCFFGDQSILDWRGDPSALVMGGGWTGTDEAKLVIGSNHESSFSLSEIRIETISPP